MWRRERVSEGLLQAGVRAENVGNGRGGEYLSGMIKVRREDASGKSFRASGDSIQQTNRRLPPGLNLPR